LLQAKTENPEVLAVVDANRQRLGLLPLHDVHFATLLEQQKEETVQALAGVSSARRHALNVMLQWLHGL
jgi:Mg/Co/Ni transporter MgtE